MRIDLHDLTLPPDLGVSRVGDVVVAHADPQRALVITIHPVTALAPERWLRATLPDASGGAHEDHVIGGNRCVRVTVREPALRRVVVFVATNDGTDRWLPLVLACTDERHDPLFDAIVASVRGTHPLHMWMD